MYSEFKSDKLTPIDFRCANQKQKLKNYVAVMDHNGPLLPAYFAKRESDSSFTPRFLMKTQYTKFR